MFLIKPNELNKLSFRIYELDNNFEKTFGPVWVHTCPHRAAIHPRHRVHGCCGGAGSSAVCATSRSWPRCSALVPRADQTRWTSNTPTYTWAESAGAETVMQRAAGTPPAETPEHKAASPVTLFSHTSCIYLLTTTRPQTGLRKEPFFRLWHRNKNTWPFIAARTYTGVLQPRVMQTRS